MPKLLVVDDEQSICWGIGRLGEEMGCDVAVAASAEQAFGLAAQDQPDVIVIDVRLPGVDGLTAMDRLRELAGQVPILVMTAYGDMSTAVQAVRNGAFEYIVKPFELAAMRRALERALAPAAPARQQAPVEPVEGFVAQAPIMQEVFNQLALAADSDAGVLLQGESGTGKELAARAIHKFSRRSETPFVVVNMASLSESLVESELFGHVRGAFTGADQARVGLLPQADGGTLFLDEVAEIPLPVQVKVLRALEQKEVLPVGASEPVPADFRLVSASHQNLHHLVQTGRFRHDLFFRIAAFQIDLPPLRDRRDDIVPLAEHALRELADPDRPPAQLAAATCQALRERDWYGNVRELRNAMEHALIVSRGGLIEVTHLPPADRLPRPAPADLPAAVDLQITRLLTQWTESRLADEQAAGKLYEALLAMVEPVVFRRVIQEHAGQFAASARVLGLHRTTLRKKLEQYGLEP